MKIDIPDFSQANVLVVGDLILDRYWRGDTSRISPEAPVPVVLIDNFDERPGGAGNVALNLAAFGAQVSLLAIVGDDASAITLDQQLTAKNVNCFLEVTSDLPTIAKLRVMGRNQQLIRLDFEKDFAQVNKAEFLESYKKLLKKTDIVVFSDYGKGTLSEIQKLIQLANQAGIPSLVDPKSLDFKDYQGATLLTPNMKEFQAVVGPCRSEAEIETQGRQLMQDCQIEILLITRSEKGMSLLAKDQPTLHLPTKAQEVFDVTGAGDTVIAMMAAVMACHKDLEEAAILANLAAGIVVRKLGAATVSPAELRRAMQRQFAAEFGVLTEAELLFAVADAKARGEKIVMTNGCFDILHVGHIHYLEQAAKLGKRLIVAVNDDASVKRLKGETRPINSLAARMQVLAALRAVDWVVSFSEATPSRLIASILPDILVKGGDYKAQEIAGFDSVRENGGEVKILDFVDGFSTSSMIEKIKEF